MNMSFSQNHPNDNRILKKLVRLWVGVKPPLPHGIDLASTSFRSGGNIPLSQPFEFFAAPLANVTPGARVGLFSMSQGNATRQRPQKRKRAKSMETKTIQVSEAEYLRVLKNLATRWDRSNGMIIQKGDSKFRNLGRWHTHLKGHTTFSTRGYIYIFFCGSGWMILRFKLQQCLVSFR